MPNNPVEEIGKKCFRMEDSTASVSQVLQHEYSVGL